MRKFFGTIMLLMLLFVIVGLARGWISFSTGSADQKTSFEVTIDKENLKEDAKKLKNKVKEFSSQVSSESSETSDDSQGSVLPLEGQ